MRLMGMSANGSYRIFYCFATVPRKGGISYDY